MANYIIGLDFGTYQTKVCINHLNSNPQQHEFFEFEKDGEKTFFLPSKVYYLENDTFRYGNYEGNDIRNNFSYFKIASAEDKRFQLVSNIKRPVYNYGNNFGGFSPELLSVLYITKVLLDVKEYFNKSKSDSGMLQRGLFGRLRKTQEVNNTFSIRLGIPTEYSKEVNLLRRKKFETILLISEILQEDINYSISAFQNLKKQEIIDKITTILNNFTQAETNLDDLMNIKYRITIYPESAAGLLYFAKSGKLDTGVYAAIDIGGGTSDISFFNVRPDKKIMYLASESFLNACNNIYINYTGSKSIDLEKISETEKEVIELAGSDKWDENRKYVSAVKSVKSSIGERVKFLFNNSVFSNLAWINPTSIRNACEGKPCLIYGGGIAHPQIKQWGDLLIYDGGVSASLLNNSYTYMNARPVSDFKPDKSIVKNKKWDEDFPILIVAFGLSQLHHKEHNYWDDHDYNSLKIEKCIEEVPHPRNEGMYIYNVLERKWNT